MLKIEPVKSLTAALIYCMGHKNERASVIGTTHGSANNWTTALADFAKDETEASLMLVQSFPSGTHPDPEQVNATGLALIKAIAPGYYAVVVTHVDKDHTHNHIILSQAPHKNDPDYKLRGNFVYDGYKTVIQARRTNDMICDFYGLPNGQVKIA